MGQGLPPSVQNGEAADPGAQPARIGGERRHGVGGGLEQDCIDDSLILEGDLGDRRGQGEDDVEIGNGQEFGLAVRHPLRPRLSLALWTVTIATGVVGDPRDATGVAGFDMPAERRCPACRNRTHHAPLDTSEMRGMGACVTLAVAAKDIGDFNNGPVRMKAGAGHDPRPGALSSWWHHFQRQAIERALRRTDRMGRDLRVARRRRQIVVAEQDLNDPNVGLVLQEMGREAVAQRVQRHSLGQPCRLRRRPTSGVQDGRIDRMILASRPGKR